MARSARDEDELKELEEWVTLTPAQRKSAQQARRMAAAAAMGARVVMPS